MSFSRQHYFCPDCNDRKYSNPHCPSKRNILTSAFQSFASKPGGNGSLCWYRFTTSSICSLPHFVVSIAPNVSLHVRSESDCTHHSVWSINVDNNRRQCGQTSCSVVRTQVQTSCNPQTHIWSCDRVLGLLILRGSHLALGLRCMACFGDFFNVVVSCDIYFLLLDDFPHAAPLSKSSSRQRPGTSESN